MGRVMTESYRRIYQVIRRIPRGRVATYGQVAELAGLAGHARQVGYALHALPTSSRLPWHRVINAAGRVSRRSGTEDHRYQLMLLAREGIKAGRAGRIELERYRWRPRSRPGSL